MNDDDIGRYIETVRRLTELTVAELRAAVGNVSATRQACRAYFKRGYREGLSTVELVDFFGVSGTIAESAGYSEEEASQLMSLIGELTDQEIEACILPDEMPRTRA